ncbi:hypothetical protein RI129_007935 [Pyrocoelia pectoralis]|uniref:F-box/LRR-repeat protein 15-like leucin rich repeat domain-containing protein n=1 Tax=Pyrocoelia pectoralis TaxID=417401 RepID=A0AAN7ZFA8_9COLE
MEISLRRTDSLISLCVDYITKHLSEYVNDKNSFKYFPTNLKNRLLRRFLSSSFFWKKCTFNDALSMLLHPLIQHVDLTSATVNDDILDLLKGCHHLREVYLTRVKNYDLSSQALINFLSPLENLFLLQLSNCHCVNDEVLVTLSKSCPALSGLDVGGCVQVTDISVEAISVVRNLQWLTLSGTQVSNEGIKKLVRGPSGGKLKELRISHCSKISDNILVEIIQFCPNIEVLIFHNTECKDTNENTSLKQINDGGLKNLKQLSWTISW